MTIEVVRYVDDPDAHIDWPITDETAANVDWVGPQVTATYRGDSVTIACAWLGSAAPTRTLHIPVDTLPIGAHTLRLKVPDDNDIELGVVRLH